METWAQSWSHYALRVPSARKQVDFYVWMKKKTVWRSIIISVARGFRHCWLNTMAQHRIWCWQNGPSTGSYHQIMAKTFHGKKKTPPKTMSQFPHQREKKRKKHHETPATFLVNKTDHKHTPILISPSVPNSPMPGIARRPRPSPSPTWRGAVTRLRLLEVGPLICFMFKILDAMKVSWLLQRRNQVDDAKEVTWVIIAVHVFICSRVVQAPWRMPHAIGIFIAGHLASMPTCAIWVYNFPKTHPACHEMICWSLESNPNEKDPKLNVQALLHDGPCSRFFLVKGFFTSEFAQLDPILSLLTWKILHWNDLSKRVLGVFDRVDSYQSGGQTTQNWPQYDGLVKKHSFPGVSQDFQAPKSSGSLLLFTFWVSLILKHPQVVSLQNELFLIQFVQNWTAIDSNIYALICCTGIGSLNLQCLEDMTFPAPRWSENQWRSEFSILEMSEFASTWLAQGEATWWYMKHGHTSKGYDMPWRSEFLRTIDCVKTWSMMFGKLMTFNPSLFCETIGSCCLMSPSFRSPGRALGAHGTLGTSGFTERLRGHFNDQIWPLLDHIQQRAKISNASAYELE